MNVTRIAVLLTMAYALSACASQGATEPVPAPPPDDSQAAASSPKGNPSPGKPSAPVEVSADIQLQERRAVVTVRLAREAHDLEVRVRGLDGVTIVTPSAPLRVASAPAGDKLSVDVSFSTAAPSTGTLVVEVEGTFAGRALGTVRTFSLGAPPGAGPKDPPRTDASGRPIVVLPAN